MRRLRTEEGFGLVELLVSLVVLNVGILAIVAGFNGGSLALLRASETSTAAALGDKQVELYRAITTRRSPSTRLQSTGRTPRTPPTPERG